jgi:predicted RecA/RadA family phage recombinase
MRSCLPPEKIKFRDPVHIKYRNSYLYSNDKNSVKVSPTKPSGTDPIFFIQVPVSDVKATGSIPNSLYTQELTYGAKCIINLSNVWNPAECGFWGCAAGKVFENTFSLTDSVNSTNLRIVSTTGITTGTTIQYGERFYIVGEVYKNSLRQGEELTKLTKGVYELSFTGGQLIVKNTQTGIIEVLKGSIDPSVVKAVWLGNVMYFYNSNNIPITSYMNTADPKCNTEKCKLVLTNTGLLKVVDPTGETVNKSNDSIPDATDSHTDAYATIVDGQLSFTETMKCSIIISKALDKWYSKQI